MEIVPNQHMDSIQILMKKSKLDSLLCFFIKSFTLCFDEIRIKSNLFYCKSTDRLVGFTEMGKINDEFRKFHDSLESQNSGNNKEREFASYFLIYVDRSIFSNLCYPFAYFASTGLTAAQLYPSALEAIKVLLSLGFSVGDMFVTGFHPTDNFLI